MLFLGCKDSAASVEQCRGGCDVLILERLYYEVDDEIYNERVVLLIDILYIFRYLVFCAAVCKLKELSEKIVLSYGEYVATDAYDCAAVDVVSGNLAVEQGAEVVVGVCPLAKECLVNDRAESRLYRRLKPLVFAQSYMLLKLGAAEAAVIRGLTVYHPSFELVRAARRTF